MAEQIVYEDDDVLVLNKPAGVIVNRAQSVREQTVQDWIEEYLAEADHSPALWSSLIPDDFSGEYGTPEAIFAERGGIAHRLDKDTSGALVIAKNPGSLVALLRQFHDRTVQKMYTALAHGILPLSKESFSAPIARLPGKTGKFGVMADGRPSETIFQAIKHFTLSRKEWPDFYGEFSLVEARPKTGRTHQIRIHLAYLSHPIVSDSLYVGRKHLRLDKDWCPRQFLHASEIAFIQPRTKKEVVVKTELARDLEEALSKLL
ncbi:MAG: RluA family pseudouridine synthase [bacterium]|nr:RluA family pseudouridine synthase [bacterium]